MDKKTINGKPYWYLREMARVDGKPKMISERYLGSGADMVALLDAREAATLPAQTQHLGFGDTAAVWEILDRLDVAGSSIRSSEPAAATRVRRWAPI